MKSSSRCFFCCRLLGTICELAGSANVGTVGSGAGAGAGGDDGGYIPISLLLSLFVFLLQFRCCRCRRSVLSNFDPIRPDIPPTASTIFSIPAVGTHNVKNDGDDDDDDFDGC